MSLKNESLQAVFNSMILHKMFKHTLRTFLKEDFPISFLSSPFLHNCIFLYMLCVFFYTYGVRFAGIFKIFTTCRTVSVKNRICCEHQQTISKILPIGHCSPGKHCLPVTGKHGTSPTARQRSIAYQRRGNVAHCPLPAEETLPPTAR